MSISGSLRVSVDKEREDAQGAVMQHCLKVLHRI